MQHKFAFVYGLLSLNDNTENVVRPTARGVVCAAVSVGKSNFHRRVGRRRTRNFSKKKKNLFAEQTPHEPISDILLLSTRAAFETITFGVSRARTWRVRFFSPFSVRSLQAAHGQISQHIRYRSTVLGTNNNFPNYSTDQNY